MPGFENLKENQAASQTIFKEKIEAQKIESLASYKARIEALTQAKAKMLKRYNGEIKKYKALAKALEESMEKPSPQPKSEEKPKKTDT